MSRFKNIFRKKKIGKGNRKRNKKRDMEEVDEKSAVTYIKPEEIIYNIEDKTGKDKRSRQRIEIESRDLYQENLKSVKNKVLMGLYVNVGFFIIVTILNIFLPLFNNGNLAYKQLFQWIIMFSGVTQLMSTLGIIKPKSSIGTILIVRFIQLMYSNFIRKLHMNLVVFGILVLFDILYYLVYTFDMNSMDYIDREVIDNEYN